ncbi:hypothetical protein PIB30_021406 [Stylosanthes scabra]|uniref:Uncharacterized protein n=1 Tax=Stylosanthes scabra TaxID=79078 RepID=A0ABU6T949_9FABA|nr:hypothetical protein [Stylosanthes scabra]
MPAPPQWRARMARAMAMVRPCGKVGHSRSKLPKCMACPHPPLGAPTQPARPRDALGASAPKHLVLSGRLLKGPRARAPLMAHPREPICARFGPPKGPRARATASGVKNSNSLSFSLILTSFFLFFSNSLNFKTLILTHHHFYIEFVCETRLLRIAKMDRKRKSLVAKGKGKLAMSPTRKSPRLAGLSPSLPPTSPKSVLGPNKLLVLAIEAARVETRPKVQENVQVLVVEPPKDIKGKKTARISVKPLRKRFSQRVIARGGPSRPKPKKVEVIDLVSDDEAEEKDAEAAMEQPPLEEEEEEDPEESVEPEETPSSYSLLSPFPTTPELAPGEYDDPHNWNYDGHLDQWGTDVAGGEPTAAQDWDSAEEEEEDRSTSSTSTD